MGIKNLRLFLLEKRENKIENKISNLNCSGWIDYYALHGRDALRKYTNSLDNKKKKIDAKIKKIKKS